MKLATLYRSLSLPSGWRSGGHLQEGGETTHPGASCDRGALTEGAARMTGAEPHLEPRAG